MPEPSSRREKLYGEAYRNALGSSIDVSVTRDRRRAQRKALQERRESQKRRRAEEAASVARGLQSRDAARQQIKLWDIAGVDTKPKKKPKLKAVWVPVLQGGSPGLGR